MRRGLRLAVTILTGTAIAAAAGAGTAGAGTAGAGSSAAVSIAITAVSPQVAAPHATVTVTGQVTNSSRATVSGMSVQLFSGAPFTSRDQLQEFAAGTAALAGLPVPGGIERIAGGLAPGATGRWSISVPAGKLQLAGFGVYPLAVAAEGPAGLPVVTSRTFLPYWPGRRGAYPRPRQMPVSWLWPLIDNPQQAGCPGLLSDRLAASFAPGGRLAGLLGAGAAHARAAALTWVIDPALLASAQVMTGRYRVGARADCAGGRARAADRAAGSWLTAVRRATAGRPVIITPFADVDVAALTHASLNQDVARAFQLGRSAAAAILRRDFRARRRSAAAGPDLAGFAWPAGGVANYQVLSVLAVNGISTVVLAGATMPPDPPQQFTPSAVTSTPDGENGDMRVLLSDDTLTRILSAARTAGRRPGAAFGVEQLFLAETAMIAAEAPGTPRAIVVAPPRRWDPPAAVAGHLLAETATAPWLRPVGLGRLTADRAGRVPRKAPDAVSAAALGPALLRGARRLDRRVQLLQGMRSQPDVRLYQAIAAAESSAWRGGGHAAAAALLTRVSANVGSQLGALTIIPGRQNTLGGLRGTVPVSISNRLGYPARVRLAIRVPGNRVTVTGPPGVITVPAGQILPVKLRVHAAAVGTITVGLRLLTAARQPLPGLSAVMTIKATQFGTLALVIVAAALGVFMISSAGRAMRRARSPQQSGATGPRGRRGNRNRSPDRADTVRASEASRRLSGFGAADTGQHAGTEDTDDYAQAPGWPDRG